MAKELCMIENNDNGKIIRRYFIAKEEELLDIYRRGYVHLPNFEAMKQVLNNHAKSPVAKDFVKRQVLGSFLRSIGVDKEIIPQCDRDRPVNSRLAAYYLGVSMRTVQKYTRAGVIPHVVILGVKRYYERDLRKLMDKGFFPGMHDKDPLCFEKYEPEDIESID